MAWQTPEIGQRVAVFLDDAASGATLGYYGRYVGEPFPVRRTALGRPERIRVYVPFMRQVLDVDILNVFFCPPEGESVREETPEAQFASVRFVAPLLADNEEIKGFFRVTENERWSHFRFLKTSRSYLSYEFSAPVKGTGLAEGLLFCEVPRDLILDKSLVLQALTDILGGRHDWQVVGDPPSTHA